MQKYMILSFLILGVASYSVANDTGRLSVAIEKQDFERVKKLLKEEGELDSADQKKLLKGAQDIVGEARENVSWAKSRWDLAKFIGGSTLAAYQGLSALGLVFIGSMLSRGESTAQIDDLFKINNPSERPSRATTAYVAAGISGVIALVGGYFAMKGYYCDTAFGKVTHARKIADLIKKAPVKDAGIEEVVPMRSAESATTN